MWPIAQLCDLKPEIIKVANVIGNGFTFSESDELSFCQIVRKPVKFLHGKNRVSLEKDILEVDVANHCDKKNHAGNYTC